jgi:hypothetical protein
MGAGTHGNTGTHTHCSLQPAMGELASLRPPRPMQEDDGLWTVTEGGVVKRVVSQPRPRPRRPAQPAAAPPAAVSTGGGKGGEGEGEAEPSLRATMQAMDEELYGHVGGGGVGGDVGLNLAQSLAQAVAAQEGGAGPASTLLASLGSTAPIPASWWGGDTGRRVKGS